MSVARLSRQEAAAVAPMTVALYTPMKPLDDPVPSGDRQMGRLIAAALTASGHRLVQPTRFRSWSRDGGIEAQQSLELPASAAALGILEMINTGELVRPETWVTYHLYHKAPDWIGPAVADALRIPYVIIEASRAMKRKSGQWSYGFAAADAALLRADAVAAMHAADAEGLEPIVPADRLRILPPFIDADPFYEETPRPRAQGGPVRLFCVAMMRSGDKLRSYRLLADALASLLDLDWTLTVAGDGPMRGDVEAMFPEGRVTWLGRLEPEELPAQYHAADLFVWPAIREAFGLVFLEAQAAGLPLVAGSTGGVPDIMLPGETGWLVPVEDTDAFAAALREAIGQAARLPAMGRAAAAHVRARHDIGQARVRLSHLLDLARRNQDIRNRAT